MNFDLTETQSQLKDMIGRFLADRYAFRSRLDDVRAQPGMRPGVWESFVSELGIVGASAPESVGGLGGGAIDIMVIMEALGQGLVVEPYLENAVVGVGFLKRVDGDVARTLLSAILSGDALAAFAWSEPTGRYSPSDVSATALLENGEWRISGAKAAVSAAPLASHLLVTARTSGSRHDREGVSLFLVDKAAAGTEAHDYRTVDDHCASDILFADTPAVLLGAAGQALPLIETVLDEAAAATCSEAVGCMRKLLADTIEYTSNRRQFGQPISNFQSLQHRMVDMYTSLEDSVSAVLLATLKLDSDAPERARAVSVAKITIGKAGRFIGQQAVQLHGGMGMTDDLPIGHYLKRLLVIGNMFGSRDFHLARYAALTRPVSA